MTKEEKEQIIQYLLNNFEKELKENNWMEILNSKKLEATPFSKGDIWNSNILSEIFEDFDLNNLVIPTGVISINEYAFYNCSKLKKIIIPDSVTTIGFCAFEYCISLTNIIIPDSVKFIENYAFADCKSLINIIIPNSVTSIGLDAFAACDSLTSINYQGTMEEWKEIPKRSGWKIHCDKLKTIHCTDGDIEL